MKEVLKALAGYNRDANRSLIGILRGADPAVLAEDQGVYYKSIVGTLEHIELAQLGWLRRFAGFFPTRSLSAHRLIKEDLDSIKASFAGKPQALYDLIAESDTLMADFVAEADAADFPKRVSYTNYKGIVVERPYWNFIFHVLNHATHHRGEISALLDRKGIANDIAGFNAYTA